MGLFKKIAGIFSRRINRFNVENRAHKVLERDKPIPAPKYESNLRDLEYAKEVNPDFIKKQNIKDSALDDRLKQVFVTSQDPQFEPPIQRINEVDRPLPLNRQIRTTEYGYIEPKRVVPGKCTLTQSVKFIVDHSQEPDLWTKEKISEEYKVKVDRVANILFYFKSFAVHLPKDKPQESVTSGIKNLIGQGKPN